MTSPSHGNGDDSFAPLVRLVALAPSTPVPRAGERWQLPVQLGRYRLDSKLGAGGMGEVYRAYDTKLGRGVAIKVLLEGRADDAGAARRFLREAKAASALNHPHIVSVYDAFYAADPQSADTQPRGSLPCIVMELIDGVDLDRWLRRPRPSLGRVLEVFQQAAEGLAAAHEAGIVHRDLKPQNLMVNREGYVKILDFGLAKLIAPGVGGARQGGSLLTDPGVILGTAAYMSPEQLRGGDLDRRSDAFSFGCVLFEAIAGERPFARGTAIDTLHAIMRSDPPPLREVRPDVPAELERIVRKCLAQTPEVRYQCARDLAVDLRRLREDIQTGGTVVVEPVAQRRRGVLAALVALAATAGVLAGALFWSLTAPRSEGDAGSGGFARVSRLTHTGRVRQAAISPDGKVMALVVAGRGGQSLWIRQVETTGSAEVVGPLQASYGGVAIAPGGNHIYFTRRTTAGGNSALYRVPILGGSPRRLLDHAEGTPAFSPRGGQVAFVQTGKGRNRLVVARADGSAPTVLVSRPKGARLRHPAWSPDGRWIASASRRAGGVRTQIRLFDVNDRRSSLATSRSWLEVGGVAWLPSGRALLVSATDQTGGLKQLWRVSVPGGAVRRITSDPNDYRGLSVARDAGTVMSVEFDEIANIWTAPGGDATKARPLTSGAGRYAGVTWVPDGRLVYSAFGDGTWDLWVMDGAGRRSRRLTTESGANLSPAISTDGRHVAFVSDRGGAYAIWRMRLEGGGLQRLTSGPFHFEPRFSPDGRWVYFSALGIEGASVWRVPSAGGAAQRVSGRARSPALSPTAGQLAVAQRTGALSSEWSLGVLTRAGDLRRRLVALPPSGLGQWSSIRWLPNGRRLTYSVRLDGASNVWSVDPTGGAPRQLTRFRAGIIFDFAWSALGERLAVVRGTLISDAVRIEGVK